MIIKITNVTMHRITPTMNAAWNPYPKTIMGISFMVAEAAFGIMLLFYTLTFRTTRIMRPIANEMADMPRLIAVISANRRQNGRSLATDM